MQLPGITGRAQRVSRASTLLSFFWSNVVSLLLFCQVTVAPALPLMAAMAPWHSTKLGGAWFVLPVAEARALPVYARVLHPASPCSRSCTCGRGNFSATPPGRLAHRCTLLRLRKCCGSPTWLLPHRHTQPGARTAGELRRCLTSTALALAMHRVRVGRTGRNQLAAPGVGASTTSRRSRKSSPM